MAQLDEHGASALHVAASYGQPRVHQLHNRQHADLLLPQVVMQLLSQGLEVDSVDRKQRTPLQMAAAGTVLCPAVQSCSLSPNIRPTL